MMQRVQALARKPRRTLGTLAAVLAAVGIVAGSGASFSAQATNPGNAFSTGTLQISQSSSSAIVSVPSGMKPGDSASGTVDIQNSGSLAGTYTLSRTDLTNSDAANPLSDKLNVTVRDCGDFSAGTPTCDAGDPARYTGTLSAMSAQAPLGTFAAGEKHRYQFTVDLDGSAGNAYQGDSASFTAQWDAAQ